MDIPADARRSGRDGRVFRPSTFRRRSEGVSRAQVDGSAVKALYRRAAAREALGELADAFRDLKACVQIDPKNRAAVAAARRVKEKLSEKLKAENAYGSPAGQLALKICRCVDEEDDPRKRRDLFRAAAALASDDSAAARALWRHGAGDVACVVAKDRTQLGDVRAAALRMLGASAKRAGDLEPSMVWQLAGVLRREGEGFLKTDAADAVVALAARVADAAPEALEAGADVAEAEAEAAEEAALDIDEDAVSDGETDDEDDDQYTPSRRRADISSMNRGDAAARTWIFL